MIFVCSQFKTHEKIESVEPPKMRLFFVKKMTTAMPSLIAFVLPQCVSFFILLRNVHLMGTKLGIERV